MITIVSQNFGHAKLAKLNMTKLNNLATGTFSGTIPKKNGHCHLSKLKYSPFQGATKVNKEMIELKPGQLASHNMFQR